MKALVLLLALQDPAPVPDHAWPMFRGPRGTGVAAVKDAPLKWDGKTGGNILWKVPTPRPGTCSAVVWNGRVFLTGSDDEVLELYAFDAATGKLLWQRPVTSAAEKRPKVLEGTTYSASTPATDGERVYVIFATGDVAAFTLDGVPVWQRAWGVPKNSYGHGSSLALWPGRVLVQYDDQTGGRLIALEAATGKTAWEEKREVQESWATPALVNTGARWELLLNSKPLVSSHDPATGKLLWSVKCMDGEVTPSPAWGGGVAIFVTDHASMVAIRPGPEPKVLWKVDEELPDVSSPVASDRHVFMTSSAGMATCLDLATGKVVWSKLFKEGFYGSPALVGDRIYVVDRAGLTQVFRAGEKFESLAANDLGEKSDCTPAFTPGRAYLRGEKHLFCIGK